MRHMHGLATIARGKAPRYQVSVLVRAVLLACWIAVFLGTAILGTRPGTVGQLESSVTDGDVTAVSVSPGMPPGAQGTTVQDMYWRDGLTRYHAQVTMVTADHGAETWSGNGESRSGRDIAAELQGLNPRTTITRIHHSGGFTGEIYTWQVTGPLAIGGLALILATLMLLVSGPEPRYATRWAWFWLMTNPLGTVAFLILSGPLPGIRPMRQPARLPARRLHGGAALLLAMALGIVLPTWWPGMQ